ncbi:excalibur calcium-binding domain-containing protein [Peiella sedimenti]|uniref:excalibur calcium-binding domain-containing protein n=1 Tax=Peiella sedimenti TaxID=3061083 RepID=UPI003CC78911
MRWLWHRPAEGERFMKCAAVLLALSLVTAGAVSAHPGGLAADGCHRDRRSGARHCHRAPGDSERPSAQRPEAPPVRPLANGRPFANCAAARAAGAAPVLRGEPGYGPHLDRDGDGIGCE